MARPTLSAEQKKAIRSKIRAAAAKLYKENGGANITARSVATEAGVSVGTLYAYFENLSEVMQSLWREPVRRLVAEMELLASEVDCPKERLQTLLRTYVKFATANPSVFRNSFLFVRPEAMEPPPQVKLESDRFFQLFRTTICAGQKSGLFRSGDLDELTQIMISAVHGSLALPVNLHRLALNPSKKIPNQMVSAMMEWIAQASAD